MPTKKIRPKHRKMLKSLGERIETMIINDLEYRSLDAFSLEHHDKITKKTLYELCKGERDIKLSTLCGLAEALDCTPAELLS